MKFEFKGNVSLRIGDMEVCLQDVQSTVEGSLKEVKATMTHFTDELIHVFNGGGEEITIDNEAQRKEMIKQIMKEKEVDEDVATTIYERRVKSDAIQRIMIEKEVDLEVADAIYAKELEKEKEAAPAKKTQVATRLDSLKKGIGARLMM